jgi:phosphoglycolate phosphatase-like HAD superfamily hydrolase
MMMRSIVGKKYETLSKTLLDQVQIRVDEFIDASTGIQTILQMEGLIQLVKEFAMVPGDHILDKFGYKNIYNTALMEMVNKRIKNIRSEILTADKYIVKGVTGFLKCLKERGVELYLASGTDKEDVINEAELLGYADLFEKRIYGSVGDVRKYSKRMVINHIISENRLTGEELLVVGDGPVEIQECVKSGGISIGVASDELRTFGLNKKKRTRLIEAGADLIIPDFLQMELLINLLFRQEARSC